MTELEKELNRRADIIIRQEKRIEELEEKISVLLSCKNCPENKGGFICAKEYENKCLAQKIQYIKELREENAEFKEQLYAFDEEREKLRKENAELKKACDETQELLDKQIEATLKLDKENARLKEINTHTLSQLNLDNGELIIENEKLKKTVQEQQHKIDTLQGFLDRDVEFDNLQKENAELKKLKRECETSLCRAEYQYNYEQLTKAKELLERLLITSCNSDVLNLLPNCSEVLRVRVEAEQFLNEVEK